MAYGAFLQLDGIDGESHDAQHPGWIDVLSYSLGGSTERRALQDLHLVKGVDKASPKLFAASCGGQSLATGVLAITRQAQDGRVVPFLKVMLAEVVVSSVQLSGGSGDEPTEQLTLRFRSATLSLAGAGEGGTCIPGPAHGPGRDRDD